MSQIKYIRDDLDKNGIRSDGMRAILGGCWKDLEVLNMVYCYSYRGIT